MEVVVDAEWYDARWAAVPEELKEKIVAHLREKLDAGTFDFIRESITAYGRHEWIHKAGDRFSLHFGWGMAIRNLLREVVKDSELPEAPYDWLVIEGSDVPPATKNWDDYYVQALEAAAL
jgi:hypothetical protein